MTDKHKAMIEYLCQCPIIQENPLFFNFGEAKENNTQYITTSNSEQYGKEYIDGSIAKFYVFTLLSFKTISYNAIVKEDNYQDENLSEIAELQELINWVNNQDILRNYPNFGTDCIVDKIHCVDANPKIEEVVEVEPTVAIYSITIQVDYLDNTNKVWK